MTTLLPGFTNMVRLNAFDGTVTRQGRPIAKLLGIDRSREAAVLRQIRHLGIGPELLHRDPVRDRTIFRAIPGKPLDVTGTDRVVLARTLKVLSSLHAQAASGESFSAAKMIRRYLRMTSVSPAFEEMCLREALVAEQFEREATLCLCHNDCVAKNWILKPDATVNLIDFEFAAPHDPAFDLATWCLTFHVDPSDSLLEQYEHGGRWFSQRVRAYLPIVDTLWVLFCSVLGRALEEDGHTAALLQMRNRTARLLRYESNLETQKAEGRDGDR